VLDYRRIAAHQFSCQETQKTLVSSSLQIRAMDFNGVSVLCDVSRGHARPVIPTADRLAVFSAIHSIAHPGIRALRRLLSAQVVWRGMASDIASWCRDCQQCNRAKVTSQPAAPVQPIPVPSRRFSHVHVDIVGPMPTSAHGHSYFFTVIDQSIRWIEAVPMKNQEALSCIDAFVSAWVSRFGAPDTITSDKGTQFMSSSWAALCARLGMSHITTTSFHPQSNGMVERAHRQIKDSLRARLAGSQWPEHLP
jgi:transposase InsO family protein